MRRALFFEELFGRTPCKNFCDAHPAAVLGKQRWICAMRRPDASLRLAQHDSVAVLSRQIRARGNLGK